MWCRSCSATSRNREVHFCTARPHQKQKKKMASENSGRRCHFCRLLQRHNVLAYFGEDVTCTRRLRTVFEPLNDILLLGVFMYIFAAVALHSFLSFFFFLYRRLSFFEFYKHRSAITIVLNLVSFNAHLYCSCRRKKLLRYRFYY